MALVALALPLVAWLFGVVDWFLAL